jgi:hypothetical protein
VASGSDAQVRPKQLGRTVPGGKGDALRLDADQETGQTRPAGRFVSDVLDAWVEQRLATCATSSAHDQQGRVTSIKKDPTVRIPLARFIVADVERWHGRMRAAGLRESTIRNQHGVLRAALGQAVLWDGRRPTSPRWPAFGRHGRRPARP